MVTVCLEAGSRKAEIGGHLPPSWLSSLLAPGPFRSLYLEPHPGKCSAATGPQGAGQRLWAPREVVFCGGQGLAVWW
jgi:hypothetical protein